MKPALRFVRASQVCSRYTLPPSSSWLRHRAATCSLAAASTWPNRASLQCTVRCSSSSKNSQGTEASSSAASAPPSSSSSSSSSASLALKVSELMDQFGEARELITDATESVGTTYFSEDIHDAQEQTTVVLNAWGALKEELRRSGDGKALEALEKEHEMKMKQLQQELEAAQHAGGE